MRPSTFERSVICAAATLMMTAAATAATVEIPARTEVVLVPQRSFSASEVVVGQQFDLTVADPIVANGYIAVPDGARVRAHVVSTAPSLHVVFDWMQAKRQRIALDATPYEIQATTSDGTGHRYFFGIFHRASGQVATVSQDLPLGAVTARSVRVWTDVRASTAQRIATIRNLFQ